jgi:uncharacterized protein (UPF0332 family)
VRLAGQPHIFLLKAERALEGAEAEFINERYDNSANRSYYACFQAAVYALTLAGVSSPGRIWTHESVHAQFVGHLINRRKLYPSELRQILQSIREYREKADYRDEWVTEREAARAVRQARAFVESIRAGEGKHA